MLVLATNISNQARFTGKNKHCDFYTDMGKTIILPDLFALFCPKTSSLFQRLAYFTP
jgi:hypothetical protein